VRGAVLMLLSLAALPATAGTDPADAFDASAHPDVLALVATEDREAFTAALEDAGANWEELARAVAELGGQERDACVWLVNGMPHLDRLEMRAATLLEHVRYAFLARDEMPYAVPDEMFRPYILTYRIEEEPVEAWRKALYDRYAPVAQRERDPARTAREINRDIAGRITERKPEFFGPRQAPLLTLASGSGTSAEIAILACAALKSVGIPSRQASVRALGEEPGSASWVEIYDGSAWLPMYPLEPNAFGDFSYVERDHPHNVTVVASRSAFEDVLVTENYTDTGLIGLSFFEGGTPAANYEHFSISVLNRGALVPLDDLDAVADDHGSFRALVGDGEYVVLAGARDEHGDAFVMMRDVAISPGDSVRIAFDVSLEGRGGAVSPDELEEIGPILAAVVVLDPSDEPSIRMLPLIAGALARRRANVAAYYLVIATDEAELASARAAVGGDADLRLVEEAAGRFVDRDGREVALPGPDSELPVVRIYARETGEIVLSKEGYDMNVDRAIGTAVDRFLSKLAGQP